MPQLPTLPENACQRIRARQSEAAYELQESIVKDLSGLPDVGYHLRPELVFPHFIRYAEALFDAYAEEYAREIPAPALLTDVLHDRLIKTLLDRVLPDRPATPEDLNPPIANSAEHPGMLYARKRAKALDLSFPFPQKSWFALIQATQHEWVGDWECILGRSLLCAELQVRDLYLLPGLLWAQRIQSARDAFKAALRAKLEPKAAALAHQQSRTPAKAVAGEVVDQVGSTKKNSPRGKPPDMDRHKEIAKIAGRHPPWRDNLTKVCTDLYESVPAPATWKQREKQPAQSWTEQLNSERKPVINAIEYSQRMVSRQKS